MTSKSNLPLEKNRKTRKTPNKISWTIYLIPILFGVIGGVISYFSLKDISPKTAKYTFIVGIASTLIYYILIALGILGTFLFLK